MGIKRIRGGLDKKENEIEPMRPWGMFQRHPSGHSEWVSFALHAEFGISAKLPKGLLGQREGLGPRLGSHFERKLILGPRFVLDSRAAFRVFRLGFPS